MTAAAPLSSRRTTSRSPGYVYSSLTMVVVLIVAALTITAAQTPPPAIAEIAPSAVQQITDPPPEQASSVGSGEGGGSGFGTLETTTTTTLGSRVTQPPQLRPRTRACVKNPDGSLRQTEDRQSPPCVSFFEGPNGGATSKGVTADQITLVVPRGEISRQNQALAAYFNKRFEFYGRKLVLKPLPSANFVSCTRMEEDATKVDQELKAFASLNYSVQYGRERCYYDALARKGIISIATSFVGISSKTEADFAKFDPYQWDYHPPIDRVQTSLAELICNQFAGKPPAFAGAPTNAAPVRKFGLVVDEYADGTLPPDPTPLLRASQRCGVNWEVVRVNTTGQALSESEAQRAVAVLSDRGVTTVVCLCPYPFIGAGLRMQTQATANKWFPEWVLQNFGKQDDEEGAYNMQPDHIDHLIVHRTWNKALPREQMPYWNAQREMDPTITGDYRNVSTDYWSLLLLASGIQAAGPNLTPQTFAAGLRRTTFANPGCGGPPDYQACVGFQGDHSMIDDFALGWWSRAAQSFEHEPSRSPDTNTARKSSPGGICYADLGVRYAPGRGGWPKLGPTEQPGVYGTRPCR